ncbi:hypothetical protein Hanom_Chr12g01119961 [Helianthus anomalus]
MEIGSGKDDCYTNRKRYGASCYKRGKKSEGRRALDEKRCTIPC